jgi:hypothetical protein
MRWASVTPVTCGALTERPDEWELSCRMGCIVQRLAFCTVLSFNGLNVHDEQA